MKRNVVRFFALCLVAAAAGDRAIAQSAPDAVASLRAEVEARFDVLPLKNGVALRPHDIARGPRSIEISDGPIAIDGAPMSGAEIRERLGQADADLVFRLSYLTPDERRTLFGDAAGAPQTAIEPPVERRAEPRSERRRSRRGGDRVQIGSGISIAEGDVVDGDVLGVGGKVTIDGTVHGGVVAIGGGLTLGPHASIDGDVVAVGGSIERDPASRVAGRVHEVNVGAFNFRFPEWRNLRRVPPFSVTSSRGPGFALVRTLVHFAILSLVGAFVVLLARRSVALVGDRAADQTAKAGAIGFLSQLLFVPVLLVTIIFLVVTVVGIPLLVLVPFMILGLVVVGLVGFTGVAYRIGVRGLQWLDRPAENPYLTTILGIALVLSPLFIARLIGFAGGIAAPVAFAVGVAGLVLEYVAWTVGFGAVALARFGHRTPVVPLAPPVIAA